MFSKSVRFGLLIVGLLITAALAYRAVDDEASLGRAYREELTHRRAATQALEALLDRRCARRCGSAGDRRTAHPRARAPWRGAARGRRAVHRRSRLAVGHDRPGPTGPQHARGRTRGA